MRSAGKGGDRLFLLSPQVRTTDEFLLSRPPQNRRSSWLVMNLLAALSAAGLRVLVDVMQAVLSADEQMVTVARLPYRRS
jgi:hypothetical protein